MPLLAVACCWEDIWRKATMPNPEELWSVRDYLRTRWGLDREFEDGRIEERNWGEKEHSIIQGHLPFLFNLRRAD